MPYQGLGWLADALGWMVFGQIRVWALHRGHGLEGLVDSVVPTTIAVLAKHTDAVNAIAPVANNWLATGSADCSIRLWLANPDQHLIDPEPVAEALDCHQMAINALAPLKDGRWLASASDDTTIKLWQLPKTPGDTLQVQVTTRCVRRYSLSVFSVFSLSTSARACAGQRVTAPT